MKGSFAFACGSLALLILANCSIPVPVRSSSEPASEITPNSVSHARVAYRVSPDVTTLNGSVVADSANCQAFTFKVAPGSAVHQTVSQIIQQSFPNADEVQSRNDVPSDSYLISVGLDSFEPEVRFVRGFFSGTSHARVSIALSVHVLNPERQAVYRGVVFGNSTKQLSVANCRRGSKVLSEATSEAVRHLGDDFVQKVVDSDIIKR